MPLHIAVDASPLILLGHAGRLGLLRQIATRVVVPVSVLTEIDAGAQMSNAGRLVRRLKWLAIEEAPPATAELAAWDLGRGESAVISFCLVHREFTAVIDDRAARRCARALQVPTMGTLGILLAAKSAGAVTAVRPILTKLLDCGMYISPGILNEVLNRAGEKK